MLRQILRRDIKSSGRVSFLLGDVDATDLGAVHSNVRHDVPACIRHGDVHRLSKLGGLFLASFDHSLRVCQSNTHLDSSSLSGFPYRTTTAGRGISVADTVQIPSACGFNNSQAESRPPPSFGSGRLLVREARVLHKLFSSANLKILQGPCDFYSLRWPSQFFRFFNFRSRGLPELLAASHRLHACCPPCRDQ